jgi:ADP-heptose:LPS heptosyltransferase
LKRLRHEIFISPALSFRLSDRKPARGYTYPISAYEQMVCLATLAAGRELEVDTAIRVGEENARRARELLPHGPTYVGFAPGSAGLYKRWPVACYIELANEQARRGRTPVFFLGPEEVSMRGDLGQAVPEALFPEQSPIAGGALLSIALAQRISLGVANDAGGGHLLAAGGRPLVSLFGRTSEHKFKPPYGRRIAITAREYGGTDMALIPVARVAATVDSILGAPAR